MARRTLSNEVKQGILDGLKNGVSPVTLATQFGVSIPTIYNYRKSQLAQLGANVGNPDVALEAAIAQTATAEVGTVTQTVTANLPVRTARKGTKASR